MRHFLTNHFNSWHVCVTFSQNRLISSLNSCIYFSLLIQHGADVNSHTSSGDTACHFAAYRGYLEAVKILVDAGADLDVTNDKFRTPYDDAERQGHVTLLPYLDASHKLGKPWSIMHVIKQG